MGLTGRKGRKVGKLLVKNCCVILCLEPVPPELIVRVGIVVRVMFPFILLHLLFPSLVEKMSPEIGLLQSVDNNVVLEQVLRVEVEADRLVGQQEVLLRKGNKAPLPQVIVRDLSNVNTIKLNCA